MRPIRVEELPPNEFFFDKKRKAVVKREFYQEGESTAKKYKVMTEGKDKKREQFTTEIAGTLGAYASANQFSVGLLKNQLKRKNRLIRTLEARLATTIENAKDQASVGIEQARLADKNEIEMLKTKLEQAQLVVRDGRMQASQIKGFDRTAAGQGGDRREQNDKHRDVQIPGDRDSEQSLCGTAKFARQGRSDLRQLFVGKSGFRELICQRKGCRSSSGRLPGGCDSHEQQGFGRYSQVHHFRANQRKHSIKGMGA
jgi:hypothetical protein